MLTSPTFLGRFIAEVKTQSPFGFRSTHSWEELFRIADTYGDALSIHTDARWGGSFELLKRARSLTQKPILAKGIHASDDEVRRAIDLGANAVLVVGRIPAEDLLEKCWLEPLTFSELKSLPTTNVLVWNARDLSTGASKKEKWDDVRRSWNGVLCQASEIKQVADVRADADCFLVGQHMVEVGEEYRKEASYPFERPPPRVAAELSLRLL